MSPDVRREYDKWRAEGYGALLALQVARGLCKLRTSPFFNVGDGDTVTYEGRQFTCKLEYDDHGDMAWDCCEPLGEVRALSSFGDLPDAGWVWLLNERHSKYAYNRKKALAEVRSWGPDYARRTERIVGNEIERFRKWLNSEWYYVVLTLKCRREGRTFTASLGGVESDSTEHIAESFEELASEILDCIEAATYPVTECGV